MKRFIKLFSAIVAVAMVASSCTQQDLTLIFGSSTNPKISATISGSHREYDNRYFASDAGTYQRNDHPEITTHADKTFSVKLDRTLYNRDGEYVSLYFALENIAGEFELDTVYPLYLLDDSRAHLDLVDCKDDNFVTTTYNACDGWIVFTKKKVHSGGYLFSGEFCFNGVTESGERVSVENGIFSNCRICWADDYGCAAY